MKGLLIKPSGLTEEVEFATKDKLPWYYEKLECGWIDIVDAYGVNHVAETYGLKSLLNKYCMVVDDESLLKADPQVNYIASLLYGADTHGQPLFGTVLVGKNEVTDDGIDTVGLDENEMMMLYAAINSLIARHNELVSKKGEGNDGD